MGQLIVRMLNGVYQFGRHDDYNVIKYLHVPFSCPYEDDQVVISAPSFSVNIMIYVLQFATTTIIDTKTL
jgi:hypothetical protein